MNNTITYTNVSDHDHKFSFKHDAEGRTATLALSESFDHGIDKLIFGCYQDEPQHQAQPRVDMRIPLTLAIDIESMTFINVSEGHNVIPDALQFIGAKCTVESILEVHKAYVIDIIRQLREGYPRWDDLTQRARTLAIKNKMLAKFGTGTKEYREALESNLTHA